MDQVPPVGYPRQPQQMMNGMMRQGPMPGGPMNNFPPHGPPGMGNPGTGMPMGAPQMSGNVMSPGMGGHRTPNMMGQLQYDQGIHEITKGLAMANLSGGAAGTPTPGEPLFNPGPGQPPMNNFPPHGLPGMGGHRAPNMMGQLQYHQGVYAVTKGLAMAKPKEQPKDVKPPVGYSRNQQAPNPATGGQGPPNPGGGMQVSTAPPTPSATSSSITAPSPSAVVNGTPKINPATQPTTSLPEVPANFLTTEFMQSVARTSDDFDTQALFRPEDTGIDFEQYFCEWQTI